MSGMTRIEVCCRANHAWIRLMVQRSWAQTTGDYTLAAPSDCVTRRSARHVRPNVHVQPRGQRSERRPRQVHVLRRHARHVGPRTRHGVGRAHRDGGRRRPRASARRSVAGGTGSDHGAVAGVQGPAARGRRSRQPRVATGLARAPGPADCRHGLRRGHRLPARAAVHGPPRRGRRQPQPPPARRRRPVRRATRRDPGDPA